jgi:hypothetical protein
VFDIGKLPVSAFDRHVPPGSDKIGLHMADAQNGFAKCVSCSKPRTGRYCSHCGEQYMDSHTLTLRHFLSHTLLHETLHLDGKIWRTGRYLFLRPGFLAEEYFEGRRQPYLNPVRLLITAVILDVLLTQNGLGVFFEDWGSPAQPGSHVSPGRHEY